MYIIYLRRNLALIDHWSDAARIHRSEVKQIQAKNL